MEFSPRNIVGCLLKKGLKRGGHGHPRTPPRYALQLAYNSAIVPARNKQEGKRRGDWEGTRSFRHSTRSPLPFSSLDFASICRYCCVAVYQLNVSEQYKTALVLFAQSSHPQSSSQAVVLLITCLFFHREIHGLLYDSLFHLFSRHAELPYTPWPSLRHLPVALNCCLQST